MSASLTGDALADVAEVALGEERLVEAVRLFNMAEPDVRDPDRCAGGRWMAHMLAGDFAAAWRESDAIRRRGAPDPHRFWNGEPLAGKRVMLRSLHGFGDAVQLLRFLSRLRGMVEELTVEVAPHLLPLAPCFAGMGRVITWGPDAPAEPPVWDVQLEVMELPYLLRVTAADLEPKTGYLRVPAQVQAAAAACMGAKRMPRVGLVWSAGEWNMTRSVPFDELRRLLAVSDVEFWSLQGKGAGAVWGELGEQRDVFECGDGLPMLAGVIQQMDLVITVDTLAAHLAGSLGVPAWVLLQHRADWRWMSGRADTPWYPTLRLWRQREAGDWAGLVDEVLVALQAWRQEQG